MRTHHGYHDPYHALRRLNDEERKHVYGVLDDFFSCFHLHDMREIMWEWLVAGLSSESEYDTGFARSNLIFVYEKVERLIEAAYLLHRKKKKKKKQRFRRSQLLSNKLVASGPEKA